MMPYQNLSACRAKWVLPGSVVPKLGPKAVSGPHSHLMLLKAAENVVFHRYLFSSSFYFVNEMQHSEIYMVYISTVYELCTCLSQTGDNKGERGKKRRREEGRTEEEKRIGRTNMIYSDPF